MDEESLTKGQWFPGEAICQRHWGQEGTPAWIKRQRRLNRRLREVKDPGYFTVSMLKVLHGSSVRTRGIDPNSRQSEEAWISGRLADRASTGNEARERGEIQPPSPGLAQESGEATPAGSVDKEVEREVASG